MGQINCRQCEMPTLEKSVKNEVTLQKKQPQAKILHRINILSKNTNYEEMFNRKYFTQTTMEDSQQFNQSMHQCSAAQKFFVLLQNSFEKIQFQLQKNKKTFVGTSKNCHVFVKNQFQTNKFKLQVLISNQCLTLQDMSIGEGSFVKCPTFKVSKLNNLQNREQMFQINEDFIQIASIYHKNSSKINQNTTNINIKIKDMISQHQETFEMNLLDILLQKHSIYHFNPDSGKIITFQIQHTLNHQIQIVFKSNNCWKYLKNRTIINQGQILRLGSSIFKLSKITTLKENSSSSLNSNQNLNSIKIIDNEGECQ